MFYFSLGDEDGFSKLNGIKFKKIREHVDKYGIKFIYYYNKI